MHTFHRFPGRARGRGRAGACAALLLAAAFTLAGCSGSGDSGAGAESAARPAASAAGTSGPGAAGPDGDAAEDGGGSAADRKGKAKETGAPQSGNAHIIRTATLSVHVKDVSKAITRATSAAKDAGGYVADETTYGAGDGGAARSELVLRVPQERYEHVLDALAGTGKLVERQVKAEDVTDQVVDVDSRVESQRASVARVRDLMDRATDLTDVVSLEGELSTREAELESLLAQQASLKDRTTLATITLNVSTPEHRTQKPEDDGAGFLDALSGGWHALVTGVGWLVIAFGAVLPFAVPVALLAMVWQRFGRPRLAARRARQSRPAAVAGRQPGSVPAGGGQPGGGQPNSGQNSTP